jgi:hypothetical protein
MLNLLLVYANCLLGLVFNLEDTSDMFLRNVWLIYNPEDCALQFHAWTQRRLVYFSLMP